MKVEPTINQTYKKKYIFPENKVLNRHCNACLNNKISLGKPSDCITFSGQPDSKILTKLFSYGVRCMYCNGLIIDPKLAKSYINSGAFNKSAKEVIQVLSKHEQTFHSHPNSQQAKVYEILKQYSIKYPNKKIEEIIQIIKASCEQQLILKQMPIFDKLIKKSEKLPQQNKLQLNFLMEETRRKIKREPITIPFSSYEFKYKLAKIETYAKLAGKTEEIKVLKSLQELCSKFSDTTNNKTHKNQLKILKQITRAGYKTELKKSKEFNNLIDTSFSRLNNEKIIIPFNKKTFKYDLYQILINCKDKALTNELLAIAEKLPTSKQNLHAYIMKYSDATSEKLCYSLLDPYLGSTEHIQPHSKGGDSEIHNYGLADRICNTNKGSRSLHSFINEHPEIPLNLQKSFDKIIDLANKGIFKKIGLSKDYLWSYVHSIKKESGKHNIQLDTSKIKTNLFDKIIYSIKNFSQYAEK